MAEEIKSSDESVFSKYGILIIICVIIFISVASSGHGLFDSKGDPFTVSPEENSQSQNIDESFLTISKIIGQGDLELGSNVVTLKETQVRGAPGGRILGLQDRLAEGRLMEGPVDMFRTSWWRVNFENAPSGWVEYNNLTVRAGIVKTVYLPETLYKGYKPIGWILSVILIIFAFYFKFRLSHENKIAKNKLKVEDELAEKNTQKKTNQVRNELGLPTGEEFKNQRWEHVKELMKSNNQNDWRQAIIEADIILDEMLRKMSYDGLTIGDMLKQVDPADFANIQKAWEAHKFRNEIAHTGSEFKISKEEAERVISNFQAVFEEFYYI